MGHDLGETRVGVHTGVTIIGNFGGSQFFDYTGLGDTVNTAARLEGANKRFGTRMCVSAATAAASGWPCFRPIGTIVLKGKSQGIDVLEPVPLAKGETRQFEQYLRAYDLLKTNDPRALEEFTALALDWPEDQLVAFQLDRLNRGETGTVTTLDSK